ncbi:hypothetical protein CLOM_g15423 [Closterium sp. NIES-68]|nr:hypothetical protein CLOM_g15423 [Closterium sp. NIES-68]GJP71961.1 hypothetical protein CLOP_g2743 [Closterium sp. NIES-67]
MTNQRSTKQRSTAPLDVVAEAAEIAAAEEVAIVLIAATENAAARIDDADVAGQAIREPPTAGSASAPPSMSIRAVSRRASGSTPKDVTRGSRAEQQRRGKSGKSGSKRIVPKVKLANQSERRELMRGTLSTGRRPVLPRGAMQLVVDPYNLWGSRVESKKVPLKPFFVRYGDTLAALAARFSVTIRELQRINGMQSDALYEGSTLLAPRGAITPPLPDVRPGLRRTNRLLFSRPWVRPPALGHLQHDTWRYHPGTRHQPNQAKARWDEARRKGFHRLLHGWLPLRSPMEGCSERFVSSHFGPRWGSFHICSSPIFCPLLKKILP